jgi:hypothetical protein
MAAFKHLSAGSQDDNCTNDTSGAMYEEHLAHFVILRPEERTVRYPIRRSGSSPVQTTSVVVGVAMWRAHTLSFSGMKCCSVHHPWVLRGLLSIDSTLNCASVACIGGFWYQPVTTRSPSAAPLSQLHAHGVYFVCSVYLHNH